MTCQYLPQEDLLTASDLQVTLPVGTVLTDFFKEGTDAFVTAVNAGTNTVGADKSVFNTWSWAAVSRKFIRFLNTSFC